MPEKSGLRDGRNASDRALAEFDALSQETVEANAERERLNIDENSFGIYTELRAFLPELTAEQAVSFNSLFKKYPDYAWNEGQKSQLRAELYKSLIPLVGNKQFVEVANSVLKLQRI